jgi:hypothetical protein
LGHEGDEEEKEEAIESAVNSTRHASPPLNREDAEHGSVKHASKVEIKTFPALSQNWTAGSWKVSEKYTYSDW